MTGAAPAPPGDGTGPRERDTAECLAARADLAGHKEMEHIAQNAAEASALLKAISHEGRLMILCHLSTGEKSVTDLERLLSARQAAVSQQLSRLRSEGLVTPRREGKAIYYRLTDSRAIRILDVVYELFCRCD